MDTQILQTWRKLNHFTIWPHVFIVCDAGGGGSQPHALKIVSIEVHADLPGLAIDILEV